LTNRFSGIIVTAERETGVSVCALLKKRKEEVKKRRFDS
jgi:hypothetical protein